MDYDGVPSLRCDLNDRVSARTAKLLQIPNVNAVFGKQRSQNGSVFSHRSGMNHGSAGTGQRDGLVQSLTAAIFPVVLRQEGFSLGREMRDTVDSVDIQRSQI